MAVRLLTVASAADAPPKPVGYAGREAANRKACLAFFGGTAESEAAVTSGLAWLAKQQQQDGHWEFDGTSKKDHAAATGMALLPFLGAGHVHKKAKPWEEAYVKPVSLGINWLLKNQKPDGSFRTASDMYAHAIVTTALCECYGMSGDRALLKEPAQRAVDYIVKAQQPKGSWSYQPTMGVGGDTSITGWQVQALHAALLSGLTVDKKVLGKAMEFLDSVAAGSSKGTYGYSSPGASKTLTPVGLLCRSTVDGWGPQNPGLQAGVEFVLKAQKPAEAGDFNMYFYYYASRILHVRGGDDWHKEWNPKMRDLLVTKQEKKTEKPDLAGSWAQDKGIGGTHWGRLGSTALCLLVLEGYYRYVPDVIAPGSAGGKLELAKPKE